MNERRAAVEVAVPPTLDVSWEDDPRVLHEAKYEDYSLHVMPLSWRAGKLSSIGAFWGITSALFWVIFGALVALTVGSRDAIIGLVLAVTFYGVVGYFLQAYAARTGTTVALFSRTVFGYLGAALAPLLFGVTAIYYTVFEGSVVAVAFQAHWGGSLSTWYLVVVLYSVPLAFGGVLRWLDKFNGITLPFYFVGMIAAIVWAVVKYGYNSNWLNNPAPHPLPVHGPGWFWAFTSYVAVAILFMYVWDYARFTKPSDSRFHGTVTFGVACYAICFLLNGLFGIFLTSTIPTDGPLSELSGVLGLVSMMGLLGVALVWVSQTRINTVNLYAASSNLENFAARVFKVKLPRAVWVVVAGAITYVLMLTDVFTYILQANQYQGVVVLAWSAVVFVYIVSSMRRGVSAENAEWRPGRVPLVNWGGVAAWVSGSVVGVVLLNAGAASSWTRIWALPLTFVSSAVVYAIALQFAQRSWFVLERPFDPRTEVDDPWEVRVRCHACDKSYVAQEMDRDPSAGHQAICASCAQASRTFYRAARAEARDHTADRAQVRSPVA